MILTQFQAVGRDLFSRGLVSSHSGNMSIRLGDRIIITRRGIQLGSLKEQDLIETGLSKNDRFTPLASVELPVHRAIYQETPAQAVIHAHPPHAVALSMTETEIETDDAEELAEVGRVPVLGSNMAARPGELGDIIAQALKESRIVSVYGHGIFAIGQLLEEAYRYTAALEERCQVVWLVKTLKKKQVEE